MIHRCLPALLAGLFLSACNDTGDFGRPRPGIIPDMILPAAGEWNARLRGEASSWFRMTDDEKQLRDRAWRLVLPANARDEFERQLSALIHQRVLPVAAESRNVADYFNALMSGSFASQASRYNRLAEDANADRELLAPFRANALRVIEADRIRLRALDASATIPEGRREPALDRVAENEGLMLWVCERVRFRVSNYLYALENLVVEVPSQEAVRAERAIMAFEAEVGLVCKLPLLGVFGQGSPGRAQSAPVVRYKG